MHCLVFSTSIIEVGCLFLGKPFAPRDRRPGEGYRVQTASSCTKLSWYPWWVCFSLYMVGPLACFLFFHCCLHSKTCNHGMLGHSFLIGQLISNVLINHVKMIKLFLVPSYGLIQQKLLKLPFWSFFHVRTIT
jgi:hypothetical protein